MLVVYCWANKESGSGLFSNERLILLHSGEKSIRYYSKDPDNVPFTSLSHIPEGKAKVYIEKISNFKCEACKGKTSTAKVEWEDNKKV